MPSAPTTKPKKFNYFIGIDVSRNELDYAVIQGKNFLFHKEGKNEPDDIQLFIKELKTLPNFTISKSVFCMENTGIYCNYLLSCLKKIKANIALENAMQIKNCMGLTRGKYDKIDSIRIAQYALRFSDDFRFWSPKRNVVQQLATLNTLRMRMINLQMTLNSPLKEEASFIKKGIQQQNVRLCRNSVASIKLDLEEIEIRIDEIIDTDERLKQLFKQITSVFCVGRITAIQIIISTNEFKDIAEPKKFACYAGVAPFVKESGLFKGKGKISHIANKRMKALLHICALNAIRYDKEIKLYYERKTQIDGKPKMAVLNAVRNKLILRIFACVKQDRCFEQDYVRKNELQQVN